MLRSMQGTISKGRLTESWPGVAAAVLLAVAWVAGMSAVDGEPCAMVVALAPLMAVVAIGIAGIVACYRVAKLPWLVWLTAVAAVYFTARAGMSYSRLEGWRDMALALSAFVFYIAGAYAGAGKGSGGMAAVLSISILANLAAMQLMRSTDAGLAWLGRPDVGLGGASTRNTTLFVYKNFAALALLLPGALLVWRFVWRGKWEASGAIAAVIGAAGIVAAFFCGARLPLLLAPALAVAGWLAWFVIRLYGGSRLGWGAILTGMAILAGALIGAYDFLFGRGIVNFVSGVDSHLRFMIWRNICQVLPGAPLWGYGAGASQWEIMPWFHEWATPNFAHNEYLQAWCDYGVAGLGLGLLALLAHVLHGVRALGSEEVGTERRVTTAMALLAVAGLAIAAAVDFVWHNYSLLAMMSFACGVLAAPFPHAPLRLFERRNWAPGSRASVVPVRVQGAFGCTVLAAAGLAMLAVMARLEMAFWPGWQAQWQYDRLVADGATADARRAFLAKTVAAYPNTRIMDHYVLLPRTGPTDWAEMERLLRLTLRANPKQLVTVTMLASVLGMQNRFEEAEILFRRTYPGDGPDNTSLTSWGASYCRNLVRWGQHELVAGNLAKGYSLLSYGKAVGDRQHYMPNTQWRGGPRNWEEGGSRTQRAVIAACLQDLQTLQAIGIEPDDSWQQPLEPGGKPALYSRYAVQNKH